MHIVGNGRKLFRHALEFAHHLPERHTALALLLNCFPIRFGRRRGFADLLLPIPADVSLHRRIFCRGKALGEPSAQNSRDQIRIRSLHLSPAGARFLTRNDVEHESFHPESAESLSCFLQDSGFLGDVKDPLSL